MTGPPALVLRAGAWYVSPVPVPSLKRRELTASPSFALRPWRESRGRSLLDAGERLGVSGGTFERWEAGTLPSPARRPLIAAVIGVPVGAWR